MAERPAGYDDCNRFTTIIVDEALRRGIAVEILDPVPGELRLSLGAEEHVVLQSLSDRCSAVAWERCEDKVASRRLLAGAGLHLPEGREATGDEADEAFLARHGAVAVKPVRGEGGQGVSVGVRDPEGLVAAVAEARRHHPRVLIEALADGEDLRLLVIGGEVVAAAVRRPPVVTGDGAADVRELVERLNAERVRMAAPPVPLDAITWAAVRRAGFAADDVPAEGEVVQVRGTANVHAGGTMHDVTGTVHQALVDAAVRATEVMGAPLLGVDLVVPAVDGPAYALIEVNAQAGLANHEPHPTAERYLDLLFPATAA
jgi:GNAT-family acetyltransferase (TIGR03103 family)